jgi:hypothetical protein
MTRQLTKSLILTAAAAAAVTLAGAATPGVATQAEAGKRFVIVKSHGHHVFHKRHFYAPVFIASSYAYAYDGGCYHLKSKALATGSSYWWHRYHACKGY